MLAVDTNVILRFLLDDDEAQSARAREVVSSGIWIASTVVLETEWVLRSFYKLTPFQIADTFAALAAVPTIEFEHLDRLVETLAAVRQGMEFVDALHRAAAVDCSAFVTFDKSLIKAASSSPGAMTRLP